MDFDKEDSVEPQKSFGEIKAEQESHNEKKSPSQLSIAEGKRSGLLRNSNSKSLSTKGIILSRSLSKNILAVEKQNVSEPLVTILRPKLPRLAKAVAYKRLKQIARNAMIVSTIQNIYKQKNKKRLRKPLMRHPPLVKRPLMGFQKQIRSVSSFESRMSNKNKGRNSKMIAGRYPARGHASSISGYSSCSACRD